MSTNPSRPIEDQMVTLFLIAEEINKKNSKRQRPSHNMIPTPSPSQNKVTKEHKIQFQRKRMWMRSLHLHTPALKITNISFFTFFLINYYSSQITVVKAHIFIYAGCSQEKYEQTSPFEANRNSLLASVVSSSSQVPYNSFALANGTSVPPAEGAIYGLYQCRGDLKTSDCSRCVESAVNQLSLVCPYTYGAALQLEGCYIRYEHIDFLGKLDTSVRYKQCSKSSVSDDVDFFKRRDDVLADLQTAVIGGFKVSSSGLVEGFAQCLGDLASPDCTACLADSVAKLKSLCGSAAAADVFLAQCYARYWASGYYDSSDSSHHDDQVGKTVAIIVGAVGGLAILIVLLSICRRALE